MAILEHNANPEHTYKMGVNQFTDLTAHQFREQMANPSAIATARGAASTTSVAGTFASTAAKLPTTVDYRAASLKSRGNLPKILCSRTLMGCFVSVRGALEE